MTKEHKKLSQLAKDFRRSFESGEINFEVDNAEEILNQLKQKYSDGKANMLDGVSISYPDWRFNIRTSNTEPLLRLNVEAYQRNVMEEKRDELVKAIKLSA